MVRTIGKHEWGAALANSLDYIRNDLLVSSFTGHQCGIGVLNCEICDFGRHYCAKGDKELFPSATDIYYVHIVNRKLRVVCEDRYY